MKRKKGSSANISIVIIFTIIIAVGGVMLLARTGALPSVMNKKPSESNLQSQTQSQEEVSSNVDEITSNSSTSPETQSTQTQAASTENTQSTTDESTTKKNKETLYTTAELNVRTGPGTNYDKVGLLSVGTAVIRIGEENGWSRIEYKGEERYVSSQYLTKTAPVETTASSVTNISQVKRKVIDPSKGIWELTVVNAYIEYDKSYKPELKEVCPGAGYDRYMDARAADHFTQMYNDAKKDGITLVPLSGYRSYELQERNWKARIQSEQNKGYSYDEAVARASEVILPPGTSEHNIGIAMDICSLYDSFANTKEYAWLCKHAEDYGFILRYKAEWKSKTGIVPEPWHWRYVGVENAKKINDSGLCLEDYVASIGL